MYRECYIAQMKEIKELKKRIRVLKKKIADHEDFVFKMFL